MVKKKDLSPLSLAKLGGQATFKKYGRKHYQKMVASRKDRQGKKVVKK